MEDLKKLLDKVKWTLDNYPHTRNSDKELFVSFLWQFYKPFIKVMENGERMISLDSFHKLPSYDSVTRCRRKLNEQGTCLPNDPTVIQQREKKKEKVKSFFTSQPQTKNGLEQLSLF